MIKKRKIYYVYQHIGFDGKIFYVGKGSGERAYKFDSRSQEHKLHVKLYGIKVKIVVRNLSHVKALEYEAALTLSCYQNGHPLVNRTVNLMMSNNFIKTRDVVTIKRRKVPPTVKMTGKIIEDFYRKKALKTANKPINHV